MFKRSRIRRALLISSEKIEYTNGLYRFIRAEKSFTSVQYLELLKAVVIRAAAPGISDAVALVIIWWAANNLYFCKLLYDGKCGTIRV